MSLLPRKRSKISAEVQGAGRQAANARSVGRYIEQAESARNVGADAELIYQAAAPVRSHRLQSGIRAIPTGDSVMVTARAVDPDTGFDYVGVTRFGHRKDVIIPVSKSGRARKSRTVARIASGRFASRGSGALVFHSRGKTWMLPSVRGFKPKGDWVDKAWPDVKDAADTEMEQTGNQIAVRWST
jgi:hypothetical protein